MKPFRIAIYLFDGVELLDFAGPYEVFSIAEEQGWVEVYTVAETLREMKTTNGLTIKADYAFADVPPLPQVVILPGGKGVRDLARHKELYSWLESLRENEVDLLSVCTGALLLAHGGYLINRKATTHRQSLALLKEISPSTKVMEGVRFVDDGTIMTSAGVTAGIDLSLYYLERQLGKEARMFVATAIEYPYVTVTKQE